jgi:hypothetical protein
MTTDIQIFNGEITPTQIEGWGDAFHVRLFRTSEDGRQEDFEAEFFYKEHAEQVVNLWKTQPKLVFLLTHLRATPL